MRRRLRVTLGSLTTAALLVAGGASAATADVHTSDTQPIATIRYTEHGMPHIIASDFIGLGYGYGYAVAKDNICALANSYVTVRAQRSRFFGPGGSGDNTVSSATSNLNSDLFFQQINDSGVVSQLLAQPAPKGPQQEVRDIVSGYVRGYNRYLADTGVGGIADPTCHAAEWVTAITELDVYRLVYAMALYAGQASMVDGIVNAQPPAVAAGTAATAAETGAALAAIPGREAAGSNGIAIGSAGTTGGANSVLLGNPHFVWRGVNRFWQVQLTVPSKLNASGAGLLGTPFLSIGYNDSMAWTHTWASPVTFGLYQIQLAADDPTVYLVDGQREAMTSRTVHIPVKQADGSLADVTRVLYSTRYGPVTTSVPGLSLPWGTAAAFAVRDANATNLRSLNSSFGLATAKTTDQVVSALSQTQGLPLFNTLAVDRNGKALYADIQVVPHVTDELAQRCSTPLGQYLFAKNGLPLLNGATSTCAWGSDPDAVDPGLLGPARMARLQRTDYVINSNQSPWLSNLRAPITGYPRILGDIYTERTPRTRESLTSVEEGLAGGGFSRQSMQAMLFADRSRVAVLAAADTARMCAAFPDGMAPSSNGPVDVREACPALAAWDSTYTLNSQGSLLFERFVMKLVPSAPVPASLPWKVAFDPQAPLTTPNTLDIDSANVQTAFGNAAAELRAAGIALNARLGDYQRVFRNSDTIPLPGGSWQMGILNVIHPIWDPARGNVEVATGSTYIQVVSFSGSPCPDSVTVLASSQSADPTSAYYADQTRMFSAGQWVTGRFCDKDIAASPEYRVVNLY